MYTKTIILASQSPRRQQLLEWADIPFEVRVSHTDESFPEGLSFAETAEHIAREKAIAVQRSGNEENVILAADTIVILEGKLLGKPADEGEAKIFLQALAGKTHSVITGVCLLKGKHEKLFHVITNVEFHPLTAEQVEYYVTRYNPLDKAGAYAIQEWIGVTGIARIEGDFYNVMGLPVSRVVQALKDF